ncbi:MAG: helix-turn-helix domain-containing protein [Lachnospiraceae bacterium]
MVKNLKKLRAQAGISQQQLADVIGVSQQSINKYENHNIEPDIHTMIALADYFGTSVDYLIGHTEIPHIIEPVKQFDLNTREAALITDFRKLSARQKESVLSVVKSYSEQ